MKFKKDEYINLYFEQKGHFSYRDYDYIYDNGRY